MDPRDLFTDRAENYAKYRPGYPDELFEHLVKSCELDPSSLVADVGSGTGIFTSCLIRFGLTVNAIEPNKEMRFQAERVLADDPSFQSLDGSAENIPMPDGSVDLVTAAQAFHWFDPEKSSVEFARVLRPPGWVALVWNVRMPGATEFQKGYEEILHTWAPKYSGAQHAVEEKERIEKFFDPEPVEHTTFANPQFLFWEELLGRAMSASYFPLPGDPGHEPAVEALKALFEANKQGGRVDFDYSTELFLGKIKPA